MCFLFQENCPVGSESDAQGTGSCENGLSLLAALSRIPWLQCLCLPSPPWDSWTLSHTCILITAFFVLGAQPSKGVLKVLTRCLCYLSLETWIFCISPGVRLEIHEPRVTRCVGRDEKEMFSCGYYAHSLTVYGRVLVKLDTSKVWEGVHRLYKSWASYCKPCKLRPGLTGDVIVW